MRRQARKKLLVLVLLLFILFVSYKILKPNIDGDSYRGQEELEMVKLKQIHSLQGKKTVHSHNQTVRISKDDVIKELINKYKLNLRYPLKDSPWTIAADWVSSRHILPEFTPELGSVLRSLATRKIILADVGYKGTQLKMLLTLEGGQKAVFKPKWFTRDHIIKGIYEGADRHNGEIAAFHLGRILEFRRTPLVVGRVVDLESEVLPVATDTLANTFFNQDGNVCFYGKCYYCKGPETGICGDGAKLEGAMVLWLPSTVILKAQKHPWRRTYVNNKPARWEVEADFCNTSILVSDMYTQGPRLMDIVDTAVFDFLVGNADRHMYETTEDGLTTMFLMMDNGKSFGNPHHDERSILAPLYQCCHIRESTWLRLLILQDGILSSVLRSVLEQDPVSPVLTDEHLVALDRRLKTVLNTVNVCIIKHGSHTVLIKDR